MTDRAFDPVRDIIDFHRKFGQEYTGKPRMLEGELYDFRFKFLQEELDEYHLHCTAAQWELDKLTRAPQFQVNEFAFDEQNFNFHMEQALDSLIDLAYVVFGSLHMHGFDGREGWRRVHEANMKKVRVERKEDSVRKSAFDVVKPAGWEKPSHADLVSDHIHKVPGHRE